VDNPRWGNNDEATTSAGTRLPRLQLIRNDHESEGTNREIVVYSQEFAQRQILENLHPSMRNGAMTGNSGIVTPTLEGFQLEALSENDMNMNEHMMEEAGSEEHRMEDALMEEENSNLAMAGSTPVTVG
jgi:hypothetical protein